MDARTDRLGPGVRWYYAAHASLAPRATHGDPPTLVGVAFVTVTSVGTALGGEVCLRNFVSTAASLKPPTQCMLPALPRLDPHGMLYRLWGSRGPCVCLQTCYPPTLWRVRPTACAAPRRFCGVRLSPCTDSSLIVRCTGCRCNSSVGVCKFPSKITSDAESMNNSSLFGHLA